MECLSRVRGEQCADPEWCQQGGPCGMAQEFADPPLAPPMNADDLTVQYTIADDGLWLVDRKAPIAEAYVKNLGFYPTVREIVEAAERHVKEKHS
jgi:hypothetical protein